MPDIRRGRAADMGQGRQSGEGRRRRAEKAGARPKEVRRQEGRRGKAAQRKEIDKDNYWGEQAAAHKGMHEQGGRTTDQSDPTNSVCALRSLPRTTPLC